MSEPENYRRLALEARERAAAHSGILQEVLLSVAHTYELMDRVQKSIEDPSAQYEPPTEH